MRRAVTPYLPAEMAVLGFVEFALSFAVIYTVIQAAGTSVTFPVFVTMLPGNGIAVAGILTLIIGGLALTIGLYRPEVCMDRKRLLIAGGLGATSTFAVLLVTGGLPYNDLSYGHTLYIAAVVAAWFGAMAFIRLSYCVAISRRSLARRVLLIGDQSRVDALRVIIRSRRDHRFLPVTHDGRTVSWPMLRQQGIWSVVVVSEPDGRAVEALIDCKLRGMRILSGAAFREDYLGRIDLDALTVNDLLLGPSLSTTRLSAGLKRMCDIVVGAGICVLLLPLMTVTALAIKIDSPGPVFYRQQRVGRFDKTFTLLKFRSMAADAEASGSPRWGEKNVSRATRVGRLIRATRIDELPQLANVLRGEMSMVGPRPERPHFVEQLARAIPFYRERVYVKPGLTGWAQVHHPYGASVEDARAKLAYDLYYVKNRTFVLDLMILFATIRVVLLREGARRSWFR